MQYMVLIIQGIHIHNAHMQTILIDKNVSKKWYPNMHQNLWSSKLLIWVYKTSLIIILVRGSTITFLVNMYQDHEFMALVVSTSQYSINIRCPHWYYRTRSIMPGRQWKSSWWLILGQVFAYSDNDWSI